MSSTSSPTASTGGTTSSSGTTSNSNVTTSSNATMMNSTTPPIAWQIAQAVASTAFQTDTFFLFTMASIVVLMQFGFGMFEAGVSRSAYTIKRSLIKCFLCTMMAMIVYWLFGYAVMFGGSNCVAGAQTYWAFWQMSSTLYGHFWMQFAYAVTSVNIALGSIAERGHMAAYLIFAFVWAGFSEPVIAHWVWYPTGFLQTVCYQPFVTGANLTFIPFQDQSGASVIHLTGGTAALMAAVLCGARTDRFDNVSGQPNTYRPHSVTLALIGTGLLTFGMLALNTVGQLSINITPATSAALIMINTMLAGAVGAFTVFFMLLCARSQASLPRIASGGIAGMVSVAADAANLPTWGACIFGLFAALTYLFWSWALQKGKVDDVTDSFAIFGGPAMFGLIGTAFLDQTNGIIFYPTMQSVWFLAMQCAGVGAVTGWSAIAAVIIFGILRLARFIRVSEELEMKGVEHYLHYRPQAQDTYALGMSQLSLSGTPHRANSVNTANA